jgi:hypothetical protein
MTLASRLYRSFQFPNEFGTMKDDEYREEAERLAQLPIAEQQAILDWHRAIAADPKVSKANRRAASERADALERLLKSARKGKRTR